MYANYNHKGEFDRCNSNLGPGGVFLIFSLRVCKPDNHKGEFNRVILKSWSGGVF